MLGCFPPVGVAVPGCNGTLGLGSGAVGVVGVQLADAMKVNARSVERKLIAHSNLDIIAPVGFDGWAGILTIDGHHELVNTIRGKNCILDVKIVLDMLVELWLVTGQV